MRLARCALLSVAWFSAAHAQDAKTDLEPKDLLSALLRIQDSVAGGDRSALPLQTQMIAMLDQSLSKEGASSADLNLVLVYALSGGSRSIASTLVSHAPASDPQSALSKVVMSYVKGNVDEARKGFEPVDPFSLDLRLAPFVALAKGTANIRDNPVIAIQNFDIARLLAPGSLIEEVALRRLLSLHTEKGNAAGFMAIADQYARRFIESPYSAQFAEIFVAGVLKLERGVSQQAIANVLAGVPKNHRISLFLRLARQSAVAGRLELSAFASSELLREDGIPGQSALRTQINLYSAIAEMTKGKVGEVRERLQAIQEAALPKDDLSLLRAARSVVSAIGTPTDAIASAVASASALEKARPTAPPPADATTVPTEVPKAAEKDAFESAVFDARLKLDSIDKLLSEAGQ